MAFSLRSALRPAAILLAALLAFGLTLRVGFMWDDHRMIEQNPRLSLTAANISHAFTSDPFDQGLNYYRPLQTVSNMADFAAWGYRPFGYHLANFAFHAATALLFFYLALALGFGEGAAFWAAALLAAHPAAVEQLLIVAGRAELAASACTLAALLLFVRGATAGAFVFFLAALGFKENGVVMPLLAAACLWYLKRGRKEYLKLLPFLAVIPVYLLLRHLALGAGVFEHGPAAFVAGLFTHLPSEILVYIKEAVLPFDMHSHRMRPDAAWLAWAALPALAAAAWLAFKKGSRALWFCAAWYLINLAPKLPLLAANDLMLDHWVYLANAGLFLWAAQALTGTGLRRLMPVAVGALAALSAFNITLRDTDIKNYELAALTSTSKPMLYNLAREYYLQGRPRKSRLILERITAEEPGNAMYQDGLALARWKDGDLDGALAADDAALAAKPGDTEAMYNRYCILDGAGRGKEAAAAMTALLKAAPDYAPALVVLARGAAMAGRDAEAEALYRRILSADGNDLEALNDYGVLLARRGDYAGAAALFRKALKLSPSAASARKNLDRLESLEMKKPG